MRYLTTHQALYLHHRIIDETGGSHGVRDMDLLESAMGRPMATFGGEWLYPTLFAKTAALLHSLARNHPFVDGNKRTAISAAGLLLLINGWRLVASNDELEEYVVSLTVDDPGTDAIANWLEAYSKPYSAE